MRKHPIVSRRHGGLIVTLFVVLVGLVATPALGARKDTRLEIEVGPKSMSEVERALAPDPAQGSEHGIVLVDLNEWRHLKPWETRVTRRVRAKVFTNEARSLGDIVVPYAGSDISLISFWAFAVLPDGSVREITQADLQFQLDSEMRGDKLGSLRAAIPGVEPGSIVEFGYDVEIRRYIDAPQYTVKGEWPAERIAYRWVPLAGITATYYIGEQNGFELKVTPDRGSLLVEGAKIPARAKGDYLPPVEQIDGVVIFFYRQGTESTPELFWKNTARRMTREMKRFTKATPEVESVVNNLDVPKDAPLEARLRAAHRWLGANIENISRDATGSSSPFDVQIIGEDETRNAKEVIVDRRGRTNEIRMTFLALARAMGAEADIVLAADRSTRLWRKELFTVSQFSAMLVAVKLPGLPPDKPLIVDAASDVPFGQVPWWYTATNAARVTEDGLQPLLLPVTGPEVNAERITGTLSFEEGGEALVGRFDKVLDGQRARLRASIRDESADERQRSLESRCGSGGSLEVLSAKSSSLDARFEPFTISCETESLLASWTPETSVFRLGLGGPWMGSEPDLDQEKGRKLPIVFHYPYSSTSDLLLTPPEGFDVPVLPAPRTLKNPYVTYEMRFEKTPEGINIHRHFALTTLQVPPENIGALQAMLQEVARGDATEITLKRKAAQP